MKNFAGLDKIVLLGFKGSGKTRVGKLIAKKTGFEFLDIDSLIEDAHAEKSGRRARVRTIYKKLGGDYFKKLEGAALARAARTKGTVVSLGGGSPLNEKFDKRKFRNAAFVFLDVPPDDLFGRIRRKGFPPFFDKKSPRRTFDELYKRRTPVYRRTADFRAGNSDKTPARTCREILGLLQTAKVVKF